MGDDTRERAAVYGRQSAGSAKSIAEQIAECIGDALDQGWDVTATYQDGSSASRYARKARDDWQRVLTAIEAGEIDVLCLWESSRGDRDAETWLGLLRRCRQHQVKIRVFVDERTYNPANARDWKTLAESGIDSHFESEKLSLRTRRGVAAAAAAGRPAMGPCPYGYRRTYNPATGKLTGQEPDPGTAAIVRDIFDRVSRSVPLSEICRDLNNRGVPAPKGGIWRRLRLRNIVLNPAYIGQRKHKDQTYPAGWKPLVDEAVFYAAGRVLVAPQRLALARPGRQVHMLTYLAECGACSKPLGARATYYVCRAGCLGVRRAELDEFVTEAVIGRVTRPDAYKALRAAGADQDQEVLRAQAEAGKLQQELDGWRLSAARNKTTPESLAVIEADLTARIREAQRRERRAGLPPALRDLLEPGADVRARWAAATVPARRDVIRALVELRVSPAGQNSRLPIEDRLLGSRWVSDEQTWGKLLDRVSLARQAMRETSA